MKHFKYIKAESLEHVCTLLDKYREQAKVMAGGQSLLVLIKQGLIAPEYLIDIKNLRDLEYIAMNGDGMVIGALTTHRSLETSPLVGERLPMLVDMEKVLGWVQIRNWGTVGGDICHADPAGDPGVALMALGANINIMSLRGKREVPLEDFFIDYLESVLEPDEIVTEIVVPKLAAHTQGAYVKESVRQGDLGIATVAVVVTLDDRVIKDARVVIGGAIGPKPIRAKKAESVIVGKQIDSSLDEAGEVAARELQPATDIEGSAEYKRHIVKVIIKQALAQAIERAREA